jgi:hypothetical protein
MRLFLGKENRLAYSNHYDDNGAWNATTLSYVGTTLAPDNSSLALVYSGNASTWQKHYTSIPGTPLPTHEGKAYLISFYTKCDSAEPDVLTAVYLDDNVVPSYWGGTFKFIDGTLDSWTEAAGATHRGLATLGSQYVGNGWYRLWGMYDVRDNQLAAAQDCELHFFINYPGGGNVPNTKVALWGVQIEKTGRRPYPTPLRVTDGTAIIGSDYTMIEFTQLPSNINDIEGSIYSTDYDSAGSVKRRSTYSDKRVHSLVWARINYKEHGHMIYVMRESLRDKAGRDCVLEYPYSFKRTIRSADIRVIGFKLDYLPERNMARVELQYVVKQNYPY